MSEVNVPPHSPLDSRSSASLHSPTCSLFESAYQILSTEFLAKSRHNNIPDSPAARDRLRVLITQTRSDLGTCLESTSRSQISRVLELQESLLAPIRTLPSDILIDIFQLVIETSSEPGITYSWKTWRSTKLSGRIYPLTWICFRWRDESLSHSAFWSGITFNYGLDVQPSPEVSAFLCECILRSGDSVPMNIYLSSRGYGSAPAVVAMLVARAHRWREASLFFVSPQQFHSMFPFKPSSTRFPLLENLSVQCDDYWIDPVPNPILECHPPLQKLCLWSLSESYIDLIAGQNLKVLTLHRYYGVSLARLLLMFTRLESLTLESFYFRGNPDAQQIPCQSSLLNLEIGSIDNGAWAGVTLPKLTKLHATLLGLVDCGRWESASAADTSLGELKEVVQRSECALQCVKLITHAEDYDGEDHGIWPESVLEMVEYFFGDLLVKAEGRFIGDQPLQDWKDYVSDHVSLYG